MAGKKGKLAEIKADVRRHALPQAPQPSRREKTAREAVQNALALFNKLAGESDRKTGWSNQIQKWIEKKYRNMIPNVTYTSNGVFGTVPGVEVSNLFNSRAQLRLVGLHRAPQAGIDWKDVERPDGNHEMQAISIVVSNQYEDDVDEGETLEYTGEGGKDVKGTKRQTKDQVLEGGTQALYNNSIRGTSVRVIRGKHDPTNRKRIYSYDGLYRVVSFVYEKGKSGFKIYRFRMVREPNQAPLVWSPPERHPARGSKRTTVHGRQGVTFFQEHIELSDEEEEADVDLEEEVDLRPQEKQAEQRSALQEHIVLSDEEEPAFDLEEGVPASPQAFDPIDSEGEDEDFVFNRDHEDFGLMLEEDDEKNEPCFVQEQGERAGDFGALNSTVFVEEQAGDFRAGESTGFEFAQEAEGNGAGEQAAEGNGAEQAADLDGEMSTRELAGEDVEMPEFLSAGTAMDVEELVGSIPAKSSIPEPVDVDSRLPSELHSAAMDVDSSIPLPEHDTEELPGHVGEEEDSDATPEGEWEVESILEQRTVTRRRRRCKEYLVLWKNYPIDEATWEPVAHLTHCSQELEDFEKLEKLRKSLGETQ